MTARGHLLEERLATRAAAGAVTLRCRRLLQEVDGSVSEETTAVLKVRCMLQESLACSGLTLWNSHSCMHA